VHGSSASGRPRWRGGASLLELVLDARPALILFVAWLHGGGKVVD
jgi:hypothetical protein